MESNLVQFAAYREVIDADGIWNPTGEGPLVGGLQISINASTEGYRKLADYFLELAERDTSDDPYYHEHHDSLWSIDGKTRVHLICRKNDPRMTPKAT